LSHYIENETNFFENYHPSRNFLIEKMVTTILRQAWTYSWTFPCSLANSFFARSPNESITFLRDT
jgi:hypothetical protein